MKTSSATQLLPATVALLILRLNLVDRNFCYSYFEFFCLFVVVNKCFLSLTYIYTLIINFHNYVQNTCNFNPLTRSWPVAREHKKVY